MRVFVSYRREDSRAHAGRLHDALAAKFGESRIFQDVSALAPGDDFVEAIDAALDTSDVVLVVIGPTWMATDPDGVSRLNDPGDYVRIETARALQRDVKVVPVLVGGGLLPHAGDLPEDLVSLLHRQAVELRDETWQADVSRLISGLRGRRDASRRRVMWVGLGGLGAVALVAAALVLSPGNGEEPDEPTPSCPSPSEPTWTRIAGPDAGLSDTIEGASGPVELVVTDGFYRRLGDIGKWEVIIATQLDNDTTVSVSNDNWNYDELGVERNAFRDKSCFFTSHHTVDPGRRGKARVGYVVDEDPSGSVRIVFENQAGAAAIDLSS